MGVYHYLILIYRYYKYIIIYFFSFYKNWTCGRVFSKKVRWPCYWCYTHTHNGFTPDTRRVVGRPDSTWREVSVRSTGFHYPWTGRRQPGGTPAAGGIQREIRPTPVEPVSAAGARRLCGDCHLHHRATSQH